MLAFFALRTNSVHIKAVIRQFVAQAGGNILLMLFYDFIDELIDPATLYTQDMIVVVTLVQLKNRMPPLEMVAFDQAGRFKLGQYPVNRGQADVFTHFQEHFIDILRALMSDTTALQDIQDLHPGQGYFQASLA
jgi:hypothetical protein